MAHKYIIVGIDPGTTVGLAMLDLRGNVCALHSSKEMSIDDIVERIMQEGTPAVIATDVETLPQTVEKVSASFEARLFVPRTSISLREKNEGARGLPVENAHERDALAAAAKAYAHFKPKFENIDARLDQLGKSHVSDEVKALVLKEYSVTEALAALERPKEERKEAYTVPERSEVRQQSPLGPLKARIRNQKAYIGELESRVVELRKKVRKLERALDKKDDAARAKAAESSLLRSRDQRIAKLERDRSHLRKSNKRLVKEIKRLRGVQNLKVHSDLVVCNVLERFSGQEIESLHKATGIRKGDIIYVGDSSGGGASTALRIASLGVRAIITKTEMSHTAREILELNAVAVFGADQFDIRMAGPVAILNKNQVDEAYADWLRMAKTRERERREQWLEGLIDSYRHERKKGKK